MENPYEPSSVTVPSSPGRWKDRSHTVVSVLIAAFGALQFLAMLLFLIGNVGSRYADALPSALLAFAAFLASTFLIGGITLVLQRRICVFFFAAFLVSYVMKNGTTAGFSPTTVAFGFAVLAYAAWRWKLGHLRGWPGG